MQFQNQENSSYFNGTTSSTEQNYLLQDWRQIFVTLPIFIFDTEEDL